MIARVARETFGVERVVARIYDPRRAAIYQRLGIPTVATVSWASERVLRHILPELSAVDWVDPSAKVCLVERAVPASWAGHLVSELEEAWPGAARGDRTPGGRADPQARPRRPGGRRRVRRGRLATPSLPSTSVSRRAQRDGTDAGRHRRRRQRRQVHRRVAAQGRARGPDRRQRRRGGAAGGRGERAARRAVDEGRRVRGQPARRGRRRQGRRRRRRHRRRRGQPRRLACSRSRSSACPASSPA